jgi:hypothetical protein
MTPTELSDATYSIANGLMGAIMLLGFIAHPLIGIAILILWLCAYLALKGLKRLRCDTSSWQRRHPITVHFLHTVCIWAVFIALFSFVAAFLG